MGKLGSILRTQQNMKDGDFSENHELPKVVKYFRKSVPSSWVTYIPGVFG